MLIASGKRVIMKPALRRERIVALIHEHEHERMTVDALAGLLGISRETVRRDLTILGDAGRIRKYHGGAMRIDGHREGPFVDRMMDAAREKRAIARTAAELFTPGDTLFVDVGTTTFIFAQALAGRSDLTVITNGLDIARVVAEGGGKTFMIGGEYRAALGETAGPLAIEQIERFHAAHAVITVGGISSDGAMDFQLEEAQVARAMIAQARTLTVLADASKLGRDGLFQVCPLDVIDRLVTDRAPSPRLADALALASIEVIVAERRTSGQNGGTDQPDD